MDSVAAQGVSFLKIARTSCSGMMGGLMSRSDHHRSAETISPAPYRRTFPRPIRYPDIRDQVFLMVSILPVLSISVIQSVFHLLRTIITRQDFPDSFSFPVSSDRETNVRQLV